MDFGLVSSLVRSNKSDGDANKYGFSFLNKDDTGEDELRPAKAARIDISMPNKGGDSTQNLLSFSSPHLQLLTHNAFPLLTSSTSSGFTPSQWMELEHQALIYKYITANLPIPSYLLIPITKALQSSGFSLPKPNALRWGGFQLGMSKSDPEPGRCRRTDGKKWRCSREAVADQKYCDRHINRGRHRSTKHQPTPAKTSCLYTELGSVVCSVNVKGGGGEERRSEWGKKQEAATLGIGMSMGGPLGEALSIGSKSVSFCNGLMLPSLPAL